MTHFNFLTSWGTSPENGPRMDRHYIENDTAMSRKIFTILFVLFLSIGQMWGADATFVPSSASAGTLTGAPTGATASFSNTYSNANQMTSGKTQTLTLSGFDGCTISGVTVHVKTNKSSGGGSGTLTINGSSKGSLASTGAIGSTYTDKSFSVTSTVVETGKTVVITLTASANSFYCDKYTITYTAPSASVAVTGVSVSPTSKSIVPGETFDITPTVSPSNASNKNINWSTSNSSKATVSNGTVTGVAAGTANIIATSAADNTKTATCAVTVYSVTVQVVDEDGNTLSGSGMPEASATGKSISADEKGNNYVFKEWAFVGSNNGLSIGTATNRETTLSGTPTGNVTIKAVYHKPIPVSWNKNGSLHATTYIGYNQKPVFPDEPSSCDLTSTAFYGWATSTWDDSVDNLAGKTVYTSADGMPNVTTTGTVYNAVFAKATDSSTPANFTSTFTSNSWGDSNSLWNSGKAGNQLTSGRGIQITTGVSGANATTKSSYSNVSSVVVTYSTNASSGAGSIAIKVGDTDYTGNASVSTSGGTTDRTITYTGTSNATGKVKITVNCTTNSLYIKSVQVNYSTGSITYSKYLTNCCTELGTIGGSVSVTNQRSLTLQWNKLSGVDGTTPYTITCKQGSIDAGTIGDVDLSGAKATCTVTGLDCGTTYTFTITAHGDASHCDKMQENIQGTTSAAMTLPTLSYTTPLNAGGSNVTPSWASVVSHDGSVTYTSSNSSVLQIINASTGEAKPVGAGTATITATYAQSSNYCEASKTSNTITVNGNVSVTFNANGGGGSMDNQSIPVSTATALTANAFTTPSSCKYFYGWATSQANADAGTRAYTDGQSVTITEGLNLFAIWKSYNYTVTKGTGTGAATFSLSAGNADCGGSITVTATPDATHKGSPIVSISPANKGEVSGTTISNITGAITVDVEFAAKANYSITWKVNGVALTGDALTGVTTSVLEGNGITNLPTNPTTDGCEDGKSFVGWTATAIANSTDTKPGDLFTTVGSAPAINADKTFYAVFATPGVEGEEETDVLDRDKTGISSGGGYGDWSGKTATTDAVYAGKSAGGNNSIQLRTSGEDEGVVTTTSGGKAKKVTVVWESNTANGRTVNVYGKNSAYSSAADLYDNDKQGSLLGSIVYGTSTELNIIGDYAYIGLRSSSSALYLTSVSIKWETVAGVAESGYITSCTKQVAVTATAGGSATINDGAAVAWVDDETEMTLEATPDEGYVFAGWTYESSGTVLIDDESAASTTVITEGAATITANFVAGSTILADKSSLNLEAYVNEGGSTTVTFTSSDAPQYGTVQYTIEDNTYISVSPASTYLNTSNLNATVTVSYGDDEAGSYNTNLVATAYNTNSVAVGTKIIPITLTIKPKFTVTAVADDEDHATAVSASPNANVKDGTTVTLSQTAADGWIFQKWTISYTLNEVAHNEDVVGNSFTMPAANVTATAVYAEDTGETLDPPTNATAGSITSHSATLSWDANANASSYSVYVVGTNYEETFDGITETSYTITGLKAETEYMWSVTAIGDGVEYYNSVATDGEEFTTTARVLSSIAIKTPATKMTYNEGETFDKTGLEVTATYDDASEATISAANLVVPTTALTAGTTSITVSYTENEVLKSTTLEGITVNSLFVATWKVNGAAYGDPTYTLGAIGDLPANPSSACSSKYPYFVKWVIGNDPTADAVTPSTVIDGNVTINAVFAKTKTKTGYSSTPATAIVAGGEYIIGAAQTSTDATMWYFSSYSSADQNLSWGTMNTNTANAIVLTASGSTSTFQLKDGSNNYVAPLQTGKFKMSSTTENLSMTAAGAVKATSGNYTLRHNYNSGNGGLRWYNSTTGTAVYLYPAEYSYSNLTILCPATYTAAAANVISNGSVGLKLQEEDDAATSISDLEAGATVLLSATPDDGYAFDAWTVMQGESDITESNVEGNVLTMPAGNVTVSASFNKIAVESVTINGEANVQINNDVVWTLEITPNTARPTVVWSTANDAVATVNNGTVHGVAEGSTIITATVDGVAYNKTINVIRETKLNSLTVVDPKTAYTLNEAFVAPQVNANYVYVDDESAAPSIEDVAAEFTSFSNQSAGEQTITVSYGGKSTTYDITVSPWTLKLQTKRMYGNDDVKTTVVNATVTTLEAPTALSNVAGLCDGYTQLGYITSSEDIDALPAQVLTSYTPSANNETLYGVFQKTNYAGETFVDEDFSDQEAFNANFPTTTGYTSYSEGSVRLGSGSQGGSITTKALDLSHKFNVEVSAKRYTNDNNVTLYVKVGSTTKQHTLTSSYDTYTFDFDATASTTVEINTSGGNKRLDINDIHIYTLNDIEYTSVYDCREPKDVVYEINNDKVVWTACENTTVMEGQNYTLCANEPSLQGYDFGGWIINGDEENVKAAGTTVEVAEDLTITPKFTEHVYDYDYSLAATATNGTISTVTVNGVTKALNEIALHDGDAVVVTATPNTNYELSEWTHSNNVSLTTDGNTASFTVAESAGDMTIAAIFVEKAQYTMTLNVFGRTYTTKQGHEGDTYNSVLDNAQSPALTGYSFQGWSTDAENANAIITGNELLTADVTLYAIVGSLQPTGYVYNKVTSLGDITDDGYYLIVNETANKALDGSRTTSAEYDVNNNYVDVTVDANQIISNATIDAAVVTIDAVPETEHHYIKTSTGYYLGVPYSNGLNANKNTVYEHSLSFIEGNFVVDGLVQHDEKEMVLMFNPSAGLGRFGFYKGSQNSIQLYKRGDVHQEIIPEAEPVIEISTEVSASTSFPGGYVGDMTIVNGGSLNADIDLSVGDLIIHSTLGKGTGTGNGSGNNPGNCGQIANGSNLTVNGDVYLELELTQDAAASAGWYAFSVPFPVDAINGVYYGDTKLQNEVGYAIMSHDGALRAKDEYAWKKFRGIMQPGVFYVITVGNTDYKTLRFKKVKDEALVAGTSVEVSPFPTQTGDNADGAWNGIGNPNLQISNLSTAVPTIQFYDHKTNSFTGRHHSMNLVVGSAFFIQYDAASTVSIPAGTTDHNGYLAPKRVQNDAENTIYEVNLTNVTTGEMEDNLFLTAREDATSEYEIGRDVAKMSMGTAKCAQMYVPAYGTKLCAADFRLINDKATYPLTLTAPQAGTYSISVVDNDAATIYLTKDGRMIWNLSMSPCEIELPQGTTEGYGLKLIVNAPSVSTDVDEVQSNNVQCTKVIIDEHVYILRGEHLYGIDGKIVK